MKRAPSEPFAAVDRSVRRRLQDEIDALRRTLAIPLVLVTHDFDDALRLATHLLVLERGTSIAIGSLPDLTSRPDLPWLRDAVGLGSVFDATVTGTDYARRLSKLTFDGGTLLAPAVDVAPGDLVRVRIPARDVILATRRPDGLSLHNTLAGTVSALHDTDAAHVVVQVAVGRVLLLAEVTRDAITPAVFLRKADLRSDVASVSAGTERIDAAVLVLGNSATSTSPFCIGHGVLRDGIDQQGVVDALQSAGIQAGWPFAADATPVEHVFLKSAVDGTDTCRGRRHVLRTDYLGPYSWLLGKAVIHATVASMVGDPMMQVSGGGEHQGPPGGGTVAVIASR